jgi:hypothetical protein
MPLNEHQYDDSASHQFLRCSELKTSDLETKPITEKMDHWYLDLKKNLMVKSIHLFSNLRFFVLKTEFDKLRLQFLEEAQQNILHEKQVSVNINILKSN